MEDLVNERSDTPLRDGAAGRPAAPPEFFASLGHDLRSQLGVVTEVLSELGSDLNLQLTDEQRLLLTLANRSLRRIRRIADMVSLASTLDSGSFQLRRRSVNLGEVLRGVAAVAAALEPRREVELACDLPPGACPAVVDAERLGCAVSELLINALRHARRRVRLCLELAPGEARVTIEDDGQGVPEDRRASLFRRHAPRATRSGLGMGLAITHDLIAAHDGRLWLEASTLPPGRPGTTGARFVASFPLAALDRPGAGVTTQSRRRSQSTGALATLADVLVRGGQPAEALERSASAMGILGSLKSVDDGEARVRLAHVRALAAVGREPEARAYLNQAHLRLEQRAARISDPRWRRTFMEEVPENRETHRLFTPQR